MRRTAADDGKMRAAFLLDQHYDSLHHRLIIIIVKHLLLACIALLIITPTAQQKRNQLADNNNSNNNKNNNNTNNSTVDGPTVAPDGSADYDEYEAETATTVLPNPGALMQHVMTKYNKEQLPAKPVIVQLNILLLKVKSTIEKDGIFESVVALFLQWRDYRFIWNPRDFHNITEVTFNHDKVWLPDVAMLNAADHMYALSKDTSFLIRATHRGLFDFVPIGTAKTWCDLKLLSFPFDMQTCSLEFESWSLSSNAMQFSNTSRVVIDHSFSSTQFYLCSHNTVRYDHYYEMTDERFSRLRFDLTVRRKSTFYMLNLIFPISILSAVQPLSFFLPMRDASSDRIGFGTTNMLTLVVFQTIVTAEMPRTSDAVTVLSKYIGALIILSATGIMESVLVERLLRISSRAPPLWLSKFFAIICPFTFLHNVPIEELYENSEQQQQKQQHNKKNSNPNTFAPYSANEPSPPPPPQRPSLSSHQSRSAAGSSRSRSHSQSSSSIKQLFSEDDCSLMTNNNHNKITMANSGIAFLPSFNSNNNNNNNNNKEQRLAADDDQQSSVSPLVGFTDDDIDICRLGSRRIRGNNNNNNRQRFYYHHHQQQQHDDQPMPNRHQTSSRLQQQHHQSNTSSSNTVASATSQHNIISNNKYRNYYYQQQHSYYNNNNNNNAMMTTSLRHHHDNNALSPPSIIRLGANNAIKAEHHAVIALSPQRRARRNRHLWAALSSRLDVVMLSFFVVAEVLIPSILFLPLVSDDSKCPGVAEESNTAD